MPSISVFSCMPCTLEQEHSYISGGYLQSIKKEELSNLTEKKQALIFDTHQNKKLQAFISHSTTNRQFSIFMSQIFMKLFTFILQTKVCIQLTLLSSQSIISIV